MATTRAKTGTGLGAGGTALAGALLTSGVIHLVRPQVFESIIPTPLREWKRELVLASGVAEIACGAALAVPGTRRLGGYSSAALLAGVFPANVQMSIDHVRRARRKGDPTSVAIAAGTLARLPLQAPLIRLAWRVARG